MLLITAALCSLTLLVYSSSIRNGFVWDDHSQIEQNPAIRPGAPLRHLFVSNVTGGRNQKSNYYRPLQMATYRAVGWIFGFTPGPFHWISLLFHLAAALLVFVVSRALSGRAEIGFAVSAIFSVHPIHSEAVDWIAALSELGCTIFVLLAFLFFLHDKKSLEGKKPNDLRRPFLALSLLAFAGSLLWKETALALPLIVAGYDYFWSSEERIRNRLKSSLRTSAPYLTVAIVYVVLRYSVLGFVAIRQRAWIMSPFENVATVSSLFFQYWQKLLIPVPLNAYYVFHPVNSVFDAKGLGGLAIVGAIAATCLGLCRHREICFAAWWTAVTLLPVLDIYAVGHNVFTERYLYLPSVGFCLLLVLLAERLAAGIRLPRLRTVALAIFLSAVVVWFGIQTFKRGADWKDDRTLFTRTLQTSPDSAFVHFMLASLDDQPGSAEAEYQQCIQLASHELPPDRLQLALAYEGLASVYSEHSDYDRALRTLENVRAVAPDDPDLDGEQGLILAEAGRWPEAEQALGRAVARGAPNENVLNALALVAWQYQHKPDEAIAYFRRALEMHTQADVFRASLFANLGGVYGDQGRFTDAADVFRNAVKLDPGNPAYHMNLAMALEALGAVEESRQELRATLALAPNYEPARAALSQLERR